jgi:uncharacterized membrane protein
MNKKLISTGALGIIAIVLGALAHALKKVLLPEQLITFETGYAIKCTMLCFNLIARARKRTKHTDNFCH